MQIDIPVLFELLGNIPQRIDYSYDIFDNILPLIVVPIFVMPFMNGKL